MLVISREKQSFQDDLFANFHRYIHPGDCLVLNNTRVFPARLHGRRNSEEGAEIEVFLTRALNEEETVWRVLVKPGKRVRLGDRIFFGGQFQAEVLSQGDFGERTVRFSAGRHVAALLEKIGETPLPPYIHRAPSERDRDRYQTVFAEEKGSIAAPTAGLHFTSDMLSRCSEAGGAIAYVTLHVGLGTFAPLHAERLSEVQLHEENFEISGPNAQIMKRAKRLLCIGTTSVRTVETALLCGELGAIRGETNLFICPGFQFRGTDAMLTNFHLPQSSLLILVCAFSGTELTLAAYRHAVAEKYRFYSYGDCMLIT